ncbi:hypothetical protein P170DRAFT_167606 [Aspergillus steynii IBT 23096]|uniref:Uncharacterized protein n=1 Tax=Aspergillus steynii IBT 23096 TaxID=1392250 RepID=A0A2I2G798_9EURO|nr:uncharacterized protein P170DRAFT_167606 [Aspergillus steynii IBT 23096]PLB48756.1 hypothetical protein P170DRAFT_167606 [Aspergillus steynii IBT 23096]
MPSYRIRDGIKYYHGDAALAFPTRVVGPILELLFGDASESQGGYSWKPQSSLAGYKATISIALGSATFRRAAVTSTTTCTLGRSLLDHLVCSSYIPDPGG